jgi:hypothetical protein
MAFLLSVVVGVAEVLLDLTPFYLLSLLKVLKLIEDVSRNNRCPLPLLIP